MNKNGYLPKQIISFAMAWLNLYRKDQTDTYSFLDNEGSKHYKKVNKYLTYWLEKSENGYYKGVIIANNLKIKTVIIPTLSLIHI